MTTTVVFTGGPNDPHVVRRVLQDHDPDRVIAADGGLGPCLAAGLRADLVIGDMDSVFASDLRAAERAGSEVQRHPEDKDATDFELALEAAMLDSPDSIVAVGSPAGRLDHLVAWAALVGSPRFAESEIIGWMGGTRVLPVHGGRRRRFSGEPGDTVSLVALHGTAGGVTATGLRWELTGADLAAGATLGVSNVLVDTSAEVGVVDGVVTVIVPSEVISYSRIDTPPADRRGGAR